MVEMAVRAVSGSTEFQIILEGHGAEWSRQKWYGWNPHILGSSKHHPELPADASGHDNPKQFDLTALVSRSLGTLRSERLTQPISLCDSGSKIAKSLIFD